MKLYHGTDGGSVDEILEHGLRPRTATGRSNWDHNDMESIPDHVYLTRYYALHFCKSAVDDVFEDEMAIFEINLEPLREDALYPDEDYVTEMANKTGADLGFGETWDDLTLAQKTRVIRNNIDQFQPAWRDSLRALGNISHKGTIPAEAITRVSVINDPPSEFVMNIDPVINTTNAAIVGPRYEWYTRLVFDEDVSVDEFAKVDHWPSEDELAEMEPQVQSMHESRREYIQDLIDGEFYSVRENPAAI